MGNVNTPSPNSLLNLPSSFKFIKFITPARDRMYKHVNKNGNKESLALILKSK